MHPSVVWALSIVEVFVYLLHLPLVWGVILTKVIYLKRRIMLKWGLQKVYFSLVKGLPNKAFPNSNVCCNTL